MHQNKLQNHRSVQLLQREQAPRSRNEGLTLAIPASLRERIHAIDRNDSPDDLVSEGFNACERLGYFIRARAASKIVVAEHHLFHSYEGDPESIWRIAQLGRLAAKVENNHYSFLREKQTRFPYIEQAMDELLAPIIISASKNA